MSNSSLSQLYTFLARCFSYPVEEFYNLIKDERLGEELRVLMEGLPFDVNLKGNPSVILPLEEFESEYINSFDIGFGPYPPCPLYESAYREDTSSMDIMEELLRFYDYFDVKLSDKKKDYPDHLVAELEFMAFLAKKEADAIKQGKDSAPYLRAQLDFLDRHLDKWIPKLDERVKEKRLREPFYQWASSFLREFLMNHLSYLRKELHAPKGHP